MNTANIPQVATPTYDKSSCEIGIVHLGFGAFHRAHQAVYINDYMERSGDLRWGIAAVNLRASEASAFAQHNSQDQGYILKAVAPSGDVSLSQICSHVAFADWSQDQAKSEALLSLESVKMVTITVTESGYYLDQNGVLDLTDPTISSEISGGNGSSIYASSCPTEINDWRADYDLLLR